MEDACKLEECAKLFSIINKIKLVEERATIWTWGNEDVRFLKTVLEKCFVPKQCVITMVRLRILRYSLVCLKECKHGRKPDHISSPETLAYALHCGLFTQREECSIAYDRGENRESFLELYFQANLPEVVLQHLLRDEGRFYAWSNNPL